MKKILLAIGLSAIISSCATDEKETEKAMVKDVRIESNADCDGINCPEISISYPKITSEKVPSEKINAVIEHRVVAIINSSPEEDTENLSVNKAIDQFNEEFEQLRKDFPDSKAGYEAHIKGQVHHQSEKLLSIKLDSYMYTGGAHGYTAINYLNIDPKTGKLLENSELFKDVSKFTQQAEKLFRQKEKISDTTNLSNAGYWFENDKFVLPNNIGITDKNLVLFYNPYEVAPYSEGPIEISIPLEKVKDNLTIL
ncbi:Protein of unknown function [Pustulibacterium marinum]|uniref:Deacetylase PdaC domain-containing protein n=1 Tax=Pustulibacterium marinum TaxID=1224947 RepID=A0A1I7I869_9FLAO|nr:DUF3298 and DUF4163 domain-containing protein [Pustulibacterium marinum]SFU69128.1 Protein of unknown function [Pustulibacterium marinum]